MIFWAIVVSIAVVFAVVLIALLVAPPSNDAGDADDDAYRAAALDLSRVCSGNYLSGFSPAEAERARSRIDKYEAEARAIPDPKWRKAHLRWVAYSRRHIARSEEIWEERQAASKVRAGDPMRRQVGHY